MRNRIITMAVAVLLIFTVACASIAPPVWGSMVLADSPPTDDSGIMIVFYKFGDGQYLFWCDLTATITDNGDGTWDVSSPQVNAKGVNQDYVTYDYYHYQEIEPQYDENGDPILLYIADLGLIPPTADDLPHSQHIGKLTAVDTGLARPATVTRKWHGMTFDVQCLVSQTVVDLWVADTLNVGDYVIVSFIDEIPDTEEVNLAIVVDKVYDSWS